MKTTTIINNVLPDGFDIGRVDHDSHVTFHIYEDGAPTWDNGSPRAVLDVTLWKAHDSLGRTREPEVSWPSTSDKRPVLARALAATLVMAATEAEKG